MSGIDVVLEGVGRDYVLGSGEVVRALRGVDLRIEAGSSVAITGPSGCGKSTLLGLLAGLEEPTAGRILLGGADARGEAQRARRRREEIGLVFQADNLMPFLTALENVALQAEMAGAGAERAPGLLAELGLGDHAAKLPDQLSGGQRQRVAIAAALVGEPRLVLADEPTGSLDDRSAEGVVDLLVSAQRSRGATLVLVTHDERVAARADRRVSLRDGALERHDPIVAGGAGA